MKRGHPEPRAIAETISLIVPRARQLGQVYTATHLIKYSQSQLLEYSVLNWNIILIHVEYRDTHTGQ